MEPTNGYSLTRKKKTLNYCKFLDFLQILLSVSLVCLNDKIGEEIVETGIKHGVNRLTDPFKLLTVVVIYPRLFVIEEVCNKRAIRNSRRLQQFLRKYWLRYLGSLKKDMAIKKFGRERKMI